MTVKNDTNILILAQKARALILKDRLIHLHSIKTHKLKSINIQDQYTHQTILRLYYEYNNLKFYKNIQNYVSKFENRLETLKSVFSSLRDELLLMNESLKDEDSFKNKCPFSEKIKISNEFLNLIKNSSWSNHLYFSNRFGFGIFPDRDYSDRITNARLVSSGGLMFYGFNVGKQANSYYQMNSIRILANTLLAYSMHDSYRLPTMSKEWWLLCPYQEMISLSPHLKNFDSILELTLRFLEFHEQGHGFCVNNDKSFYNFLKSMGISDDDLYKNDFPDDDELKSWQRMKKGNINVKDVCFLFGDLFANLAVIFSNIDSETLKVLRAFIWGITPAPGPNRRPRGNVCFIRYAIDKDFNHLCKYLEKIFFLAKKASPQTLNVMQDMEKECFTKLKTYYNLSDNFCL